MPIYEYYCPNCQKSFDIAHKVADRAQTMCPECKQPTLQRKFSKVGLSFQGSGFYITDYARKERCDEPSQEKKKGACDKPGGCGCAH